MNNNSYNFVTNGREKKVLPYSVGVIAIVSLVVSVFMVISVVLCLFKVNDDLEARLEGIEYILDDAIESKDSNELSHSELNVEIASLKEQYDSFINNITIMLSIFALLVTICTIIMPIYTYNFLQKDQIDLFHKITKDEIQSIKNEHNDIKNEFNNQIKSIKDVEQNFEKWIDELFSPLDFSEIRIEPVYNIARNEIEDFYKRAYVHFSLGKTQKAMEILDLILKCDSNNEKALLAKAQVLYSLDGYDDAVLTMDSLITNTNKPEHYFMRGCINFKSKNYNSAVNDFLFVYHNQPNNEQNLIKLAAALHKDRQTEKAIGFQNLAIQINSNNAQYFADRGIMYHALKKYTEALSDKKHALTLAPDNGQYYGIYAATLYKAKDYQNALYNANVAIEKDNQLAFVYSFRGLIKLSFKNKFSDEEILKDLSDAINYGEDNYRNYYRRAEFYINKNEPDKAIIDLDKAYSIDPKDPEIMQLYSLVYKLKGDANKSKEYENKANDLGFIPEP